MDTTQRPMVSMSVSDIAAYLRPETSLERHFLTLPEFQEGLFWGKPRFGHPEGQVLYHIREVLDNVDKLLVSGFTRQQLRLVTFVHDTFKYMEQRTLDAAATYVHHGVFARHFTAAYVSDPFLLDVIELHDEAYYIWRLGHLQKDYAQAQHRYEAWWAKVGHHIQFYYQFFRCDTCTGDKIMAPLKWFEQTIPDIDIIGSST